MPDAPSSTSRYLLVSDLDGTLLGDTPALERFAEWYEPRRERLALAYSSGRLHGSMLGSIQNSPLPEPNYVVSGVGTEIRTYGSDVAWADWHGHFADWSAKTVCSIIEEAFNLERQPEEFLSPWKVSYYAHDLSEAEVVRIAAKLESAGLRVRLIYSSARDLDILPAAAGKGGAARFLAQREGFQRERLFG
ncbi:MAG: hypothetical protein KDA75_09030, partial [Planctomycetaceae bacterium]|nr:hypothetical protein [Planctomycetaceae bacterium]